MLRNKTIDRICCIALAVMLALTTVVWIGKANAGRQSTITVGYEGLFDQSIVHTIDIEIDDWEGFIESASQELYALCSVTIDGEKISNVGIRGKGNTSLSSVSSSGSEKYSFKIEFDQYVSGKTYHGLDKLSLNNLIYDATMMKDYLAYTLMNREGVPAPLCSFAQITVNGEPWGLYLAVEGVEDSFMERNNMTTGELYKPDSLNFGGGRGNGMDFDFEQFRVKDDDDTASAEGKTSSSDRSDMFSSFFSSDFGGQTMPGGFSGQMPSDMNPSNGFTMPGSSDGSSGFQMPGGLDGSNSFQMPGSSSGFGGFQMPGGSNGFGGFQMPEGIDIPDSFQPSGDASDSGRGGNFSFGGGMFNFGMGNGDVKLQYTDDDESSYANIFDSAKTEITQKDKTRLIQALKTLSSENAQDAVFTDEVIRYLAVHDFLQNSDSYTGMMVHNYYLYEEDGKLAIIPWDYNLAFGGMGGGGDASSTVNSPIDSPVTSGSVSDRPLIAWILEDEEALKKYHEVYSQFIADTIESGWLKSEIARVAEMIRPYVEKDANSFFSVEEFDAAVETLQSYCALRGESIRGQLEGTIPSTSDGQRRDSSALVDTGSLNLSAMGSMNTGGGDRGNGGFSMPGNGSFGAMSGNSFSMPSGSKDTDRGAQSGQSDKGGSFSMPSGSSKPDKTADSDVSGSEAEAPDGSVPTQQKAPSDKDRTSFDRKQWAGGFSPSGMTAGGNQDTWLIFGICAALLLASIIVAAKIKGHNA